MAKRITEFTGATSLAEGDLFALVDVSDTTQATSGTTKKSALSLIADYIKARVETITNKTIDGDSNTVSNLAHGAEVDNPSSGVHGVTGDVVGTTDTQTLTNKTLTSPKINEDVAVTATATELNYVDGVTSAIQTQLNAKQASLSLTKLASGKVTDFPAGVTISSIGASGIYLVFTEGWAATADGKVGFAICSNISGAYSHVNTILSGTYSGTVTMPSGTSIKIVPYNGDGAQYLILRLNVW